MFLPWLLSRRRLDHPERVRIEDAYVRGMADGKMPGIESQDRRGMRGDPRERRRQRHLVLACPFERQRQQQFQTGRAGLGFGERQLLRVVVDRRVVGTHEIDRAVGEARAQRRAIAGAAQRRHEAALRVEPADVDVAQMQMMHGDVAGHRQLVLLRGAHHRDAIGGRQPGKMHARTGLADEREDRRQRDRLRGSGNRGQPETRRHLAVVRDAAAGEMRILRTQPYAVPERRGVLQRAKAAPACRRAARRPARTRCSRPRPARPSR